MSNRLAGPRVMPGTVRKPTSSYTRGVSSVCRCEKGKIGYRCQKTTQTQDMICKSCRVCKTVCYSH